MEVRLTFQPYLEELLEHSFFKAFFGSIVPHGR